jgi:PAS domain S-box-containing protein
VGATGWDAGAVTGRGFLDAEGIDARGLFELAMDHAAIGMAIVGVDGRFITVNRALSRILGHPPDALTSMTFQELTHPDDLAIDLELVRALADGEIDHYHLEKRYLRADGSIVWGLLSGASVRDATGRLRCYLAQIQDITARKDAERDLQETMDALRRSNEALTDFAASAAHDLKSPLVNAHSLLELLWLEAAGGLSASQRELLDRARARLLQLAEQVDGLLCVAAAAGTNIVADEVEVAELVAHVLDALGDDLDGLGVVTEPCPLVRANPGALRLVVQNLLVNAAAHGARKVRVHGSIEDGSVRVCFDDDGPGIDPASRQVALDLFEKGPASLGIGVGLATCRRIIERHGGTIGVGEAPEGGARIWFSLPAAGPA